GHHRALRPTAASVRLPRTHPARKRRRDPAHRCPAHVSPGEWTLGPYLRGPILRRGRQTGFPESYGRDGAREPGFRRGLPRLPAIAEAVASSSVVADTLSA